MKKRKFLDKSSENSEILQFQSFDEQPAAKKMKISEKLTEFDSQRAAEQVMNELNAEDVFHDVESARKESMKTQFQKNLLSNFKNDQNYQVLMHLSYNQTLAKIIKGKIIKYANNPNCTHDKLKDLFHNEINKEIFKLTHVDHVKSQFFPAISSDIIRSLKSFVFITNELSNIFDCGYNPSLISKINETILKLQSSDLSSFLSNENELLEINRLLVMMIGEYHLLGQEYVISDESELIYAAFEDLFNILENRLKKAFTILIEVNDTNIKYEASLKQFMKNSYLPILEEQSCRLTNIAAESRKTFDEIVELVLGCYNANLCSQDPIDRDVHSILRYQDVIEDHIELFVDMSNEDTYDAWYNSITL